MYLDKNCLASLEFEIAWQSPHVEHKERFLARKVNLKRDILPLRINEALNGLQVGESTTLNFAPGQIVADYSPRDVHHLPYKSFRPQGELQREIQPHFGRFYPKGFLSDVRGIYPQNSYPFRVIGVEEEFFIADLNHPLARYATTVTVMVHDLAVNDGTEGGKCSVWMEEIADNGPGMQARWREEPTDFQLAEPLKREDEQLDTHFYSKPRLVEHIDAQASLNLQAEYGRYLQAGMRVLDLMSSMQSHLPPEMDLEVHGLGLNQEELDANQRLEKRIVQDINANSELPFANDFFDALVCSLSVEYLIQPGKAVREMHRVLKPGGILLLSFSNRWFPPKVTKLWEELHEFERLGLVLELLLRDGGFEDLQSVSMRNWWRPTDDKWYGRVWTSDPIFVVFARCS